MEAIKEPPPLPSSQASDLHLANPTPEELEVISRMTFAEWGDALTLPQFLEESDFLTKVPLARNGGMASWILTEQQRPPSQRPILASCETFRKRAFVTDPQNRFSENTIYGIASVFVNQDHRGQGYGRRLMQELAKLLPTLHVGSLTSIGSVLYSDIGSTYYTKLGWPVPDVSFHLEFDAKLTDSMSDARSLQEHDLPPLCRDDEAMLRTSMAALPPGKTRFMIVPDSDHMLWHISKENFACQKIWKQVAPAKGAISGQQGNRVWAIWVHRYYGDPKLHADNNVLYILRFVVENQEPSPNQLESIVQSVKVVLERAQAEASEWNLQRVKLWHPSPSLQNIINRSGLQHECVQRENNSIASLRWSGGANFKSDEVEWLACEKYAWV